METNVRNCIGCAECCISLTEKGKFLIPLTKEDAQILRKNEMYQRLRKNGKITIKKGEFDPYYPYDLVAKGLCPFLDPARKFCNIYPDRPTGCRKFECQDI